MNKAFFMLLLLPLVGIAQKNGFKINGAFTGVKEKSVVSLTDANNPTDTIHASSVSNGKFYLTGKLNEPGLYYLNFSDSPKKGLLFLDNNNVVVSGDVDALAKMKVEGSSSHKDFEVFQSVFTPLVEKLNKVRDQAKVRGMTDSLNEIAVRASEDIKAQVERFVAKRKASFVSPFVLLVTAQLPDDVQSISKLYAGLSGEVQQGYYGKYLKTTLEQFLVGAVGTKAIDFTQNDPDGKPVTLSSFKGKYVLVDFWASWCGPCRQENPNVVNTYHAYKGKNFTVLGVSLDRSKDPWLKAIKDDNLAWTHVSDLKFWSNEVARKYNIQSIPQNFLIDPNGNIIARNLRGPDLGQRLGELLK